MNHPGQSYVRRKQPSSQKKRLMFASVDSTRENGRESDHVGIERLLFTGDVAERCRCYVTIDESRQNAMRASRQSVAARPSRVASNRS